MANKIFEYIELKYTTLTNQVTNWLKDTYSRSDLNFSPASPYGQLLNILKEFFEHNIIYLKNAVKVLDIDQTTNKKVIQQIARISGHNVSRAISASGTLKFKLKPGIDIAKEIKDSVIRIDDKLLLKNKTNSLFYTVKLNVEKNVYPINLSNTQFYLPIVQGKYETQRFTGNGAINQSYSVNIPNNSQIDNFNYTIKYNGVLVSIKDHMYDMLPNEISCYTRSGFNGGLDMYFGNSNYGFIPAQGSIIEVSYLLSNGSEGEIFNNLVNDWKIIGDITDGQGNTVKTENLFDISIYTDINFASDGESIEYTKAIIPYVSRNFVLGTPNQFIFHLKRLNIFSKVNAYNKLEDNDFSISDDTIEKSINKITKDINDNLSRDVLLNDIDNFNKLYARFKNNLNDNEIYLYLIPQIKKYFNDDINYFNVPFEVFYLSEDEEDKVMLYLKQLGTMSITTNVIIVQPTITRYVMHVYIRRYDYASEENIKQEIIAKTSDYLLTNDRFDRIPKADLIQLYKEIEGVDSASVYFVSQQNEDYHKKGADLGYIPEYSKVPKYDSSNTTTLQSFKPKVQPILAQSMIMKNGVLTQNLAYDPNKLIGIDPVHGDIVIEKDEYAIIRGGFRDRKGIWYNENPEDSSLNSINIVFDGVTEK